MNGEVMFGPPKTQSAAVGPGARVSSATARGAVRRQGRAGPVCSPSGAARSSRARTSRGGLLGCRRPRPSALTASFRMSCATPRPRSRSHRGRVGRRGAHARSRPVELTLDGTRPCSTTSSTLSRTVRHVRRGCDVRPIGTNRGFDGRPARRRWPDLRNAAPPAGFEPATHGLGNRCSIP